jgi:hypothetical protein
VTYILKNSDEFKNQSNLLMIGGILAADVRNNKNIVNIVNNIDTGNKLYVSKYHNYLNKKHSKYWKNNRMIWDKATLIDPDNGNALKVF